MPSTYYTLDGEKHIDFRYRKEAAYDNFAPTSAQHAYRKASGTNRSDLRGKVCPGCGVTRSMANKCECNS